MAAGKAQENKYTSAARIIDGKVLYSDKNYIYNLKSYLWKQNLK